MFDPVTISRRRVVVGLPLGLAGFGLLSTATGTFAAGLAGELDTSFAFGGKYLSDWGGTSTFGPGIALQANGALVIGGKNKTTTLDQFAAFRLSSSGALDTSFGVNGLVQATFGSSIKPATNDENIKVVTLQFDGKILLGGEGNAGGPGQHGVMRLNTNGSLDTTFGDRGKVLIDFGRISHVHDIKQQSDGKLLVIGDYYSGTAGTLALARLNVNGTLDTSFSTGGKMLKSFGDTTNGHCVTALADGRIVMSGYVDNTTTGLSSAFFVMRLSANGLIDKSFGTDGSTLVQAGGASPNNNNYCHWQLVQPDGKIVVFGGSVINRVGNIAMVRLTADGVLDSSFGTGGIVVTDFTGTAATTGEEAATGALQTDGKIVAAGYCEGRFMVARYTSSGVLDSTFATGGKTFITVGTGGDDFVKSMLIQPDGKIAVAGYSKNAGRFTMGVVRLLNDVTGLPVASSDTERLFRWAEAKFATYFPPGPTTEVLAGYTLRHYTSTAIYLGVKDGTVVVYGAVFGGLLSVGLLSELLLQAARDGY